MRKKRIMTHRSKNRGRRLNKQYDQHRYSQVEKGVLSLLYTSGKSLHHDELGRLSTTTIDKKTLTEALNGLLAANKIIKKKQGFSLSPHLSLGQANLVVTESGYGFATDVEVEDHFARPIKDPYIAKHHLGSARHGDTILIDIFNTKSDGRSEASVLSVLSRQTLTVAGYIRTIKQDKIVVSPEDPRHPFDILITTIPEFALTVDDAVLVKLEEGGGSPTMPVGEIAKVLGNPEHVDTKLCLVTTKFDLPHEFSAAALEEADTAVAAAVRDGRRDLQEITHVTIDGEEARDFDDAIAIHKEKNGFRLFVSIADVSAFVKPGTHLDGEAYERGTSVYFPHAVIPMLPATLSNDACSLRPGENRLTITVEIAFDNHGVPRSAKIYRSIITSKRRFTYDEVQAILDSKLSPPHLDDDLRTLLDNCAELARLIQKQRHRRGAITLDTPEVTISITDDGKAGEINSRHRSFAHQLIEEFMLAANEAVARYLTERAVPTLYRIHEEPSPIKAREFEHYAASLGLYSSHPIAGSAWYNEMVARAQDAGQGYLVNSLILRTMQQARYSPENPGHFGLAAPVYCHFTSPIRRYPDLIVHRLLSHLLELPPNTPVDTAAGTLGPFSQLSQAGQHLSDRERTAVAAERDMAGRLKCQYLADHIGQFFQAVVSGVTESLFYVELIDLMISGVVYLSSLDDDYYILDAKKHRLVGDVTRRILRVGDQLTVCVHEVDKRRMRIVFQLICPTSE